MTGKGYGAGEFLAVHEYRNLIRWADTIAQRPAVLRGQIVNRTWGDESVRLPERHSSEDIDKALAGV